MSAVRTAVEGAVEEGVSILTLYAFSTENWQRPEEEVLALMTLLKLYAASERSDLRERGVAVRILGNFERMDAEALEAMEEIQAHTRSGNRLLLNLMISYSGRAEILRAVRKIAYQVRSGHLLPEKIEEEDVESHLYTHGLPDPDLLIRTSGEFRLSNFLLWQLAYTEIHISPVLWPDFTRAELRTAIQDFQGRQRRFGRVTSLPR
jgi:undecaprenyl diphosphate synthase